MQEMIQFDISMMSAILLGIMYVIAKIKQQVTMFASDLFKWIIIFNLIGLVAEPLTWIFDARSGMLIFVLEYISNFILVITGPILVGLWASYLDYKLFFDKKRIYRFKFYQTPSIIILILLIVNFFTPTFFIIQEGPNNYIQGPLHILRYVLTYLLFFRLLYLIFTNQQKEKAQTLKGIILFMIIPATGALAQFMNPSILTTWPFFALAVVVMYIFLETIPGDLDYLTKLYSRRVLEAYLGEMIEKGKPFEVIMIDLDNFKSVNDIYGHKKGDEVLIQFAELLKRESTPGTLISRLGGDEFLIVIDLEQCKDATLYLASLKKAFKEHAFLSSFGDLKFSEGHVSFEENMSLDDLLLIADKRMYEHKRKTQKTII
ncbi:MAG: hypothetical protein CVV61_01455 [Tenericutes bacterium HGW-Tenericutes-6]|nr:MAG: hypothetical protein CVV61_01455 [Tenericutes bacterium HGW-Tenericutes-6]